MIRVHVRIERCNELQIQFVDQGRVPSRLLEHRIDQHRFETSSIGEQVRIRR
jgi:hypothetical protein